jgi:cytochrome c oxidase subunit 2
VGQTAAIITVSYVIAVVVGAIVCIGIWRSTRRGDTEGVDEALYSRGEGVWLVIVLALLFALLMATIFYVPYGETAGPDKQVVRVTGVQFAWAVEPSTVRAGVPVEFHLVTSDVTHGVGIYDGGKLLVQAQVIPGQIQKLVYTFDEPGTYDLLCLEYCGKDHHEMVSALEVRP